MNTKVKMVLNFIKDKDKKSYFLIFEEFSKLYRKEKKFPMHYFTRYAYKKNFNNPEDCVSYSIIQSIWNSDKLHTQYTKEILDNKLNFNNFCMKNKIIVPSYIGYTKNNIYTNCKNIKYKFNNIEELIRIFKMELKNFENDIFIKPLDGMQGKGCYLINNDNLLDIVMIKEIYSSTINSGFLLQEVVEQNHIINKLNPYSLNTIRFITYLNEENVPYIISALMRVGRKGSIVDNLISKGFFIGVNLDNGRFNEYGIQMLDVSSKKYISIQTQNIK